MTKLIQINNPSLFLEFSSVYSLGKAIKNIYYVLKDTIQKEIYVLELNDNTKVRLDIRDDNFKTKRNVELRFLAQQNNVDLSKLLEYVASNGKMYIFTYWIEGSSFRDVSLSKQDTDELYIKFGRLVGHLNSIKENNMLLASPDIRLENFIIDVSNNLFMVDHDMLEFLDRTTLDSFIVLSLVSKKCLAGIERRVNMFLSGYSDFFDVGPILESYRKLKDKYGQKLYFF